MNKTLLDEEVLKECALLEIDPFEIYVPKNLVRILGISDLDTIYGLLDEGQIEGRMYRKRWKIKGYFIAQYSLSCKAAAQPA